MDNFDNFVNVDNFDAGHFLRKYAASGQGGALTQTPILDNFDNFDNFDSGHFPRKYAASGQGWAEGGSHFFYYSGDAGIYEGKWPSSALQRPRYSEISGSGRPGCLAPINNNQ